ncbi:MAG TPA: competence/damage-inducible protein A [Gemmataceae bacterium]|jgi:nicotinamide-nucleotide amidase|nr:competence/damage-inducible protein A [Gemmataceae bacterium]
MKTEIISIGTEITSGQSLDTNSQWLSQRLAEIGIPVAFHTTVADDLADNLNVFRAAVSRAKQIIVTGGLGPTLDDLTREVLAQVAGVELVFHEPSWLHIKELFSKRFRHLPERNRVQAMLPAGADAIPNPIGTAPGIWMKIGETLIVAMPGVPSEMYLMFAEQVRPRLLGLGLGGGVFIQRKINTFGAGESAVEEKLKDVTRRGAVPEVGITASDAVISLRILARASTVDEARALCEPVEKIIRERLGNLVYGVDNEELHDAVLRLLAEKNLTVATAESMTAGLVAHKLAQVPGASNYLRGGIVCYDSRVKVEQVGVPEALIKAHTAVSAEVAEALAVNIRQKLHADLGVSVVGYAGPDAGGPEKPVGTTFVGVAWQGGAKTHKFVWPGTRNEIQTRAAKMALNALRLQLLGQ